MASDYEVEIFRNQGFQRRQCPKCSTWFWTLGEQVTCGETPCVEYTFIGAPPFSKKLTTKAMREDFLSYLEANGHTRVKRYPIVARWREDVFFTQASIYPFQPWVINGDVEPPANPLAISQPCVRFTDIDNVGKTGRHFTLFEMMAHHVFNRPVKEIYFRDRTVELCQKFLTDRLGAAPGALTYKESWWNGGGNSGPCFEVIVAGAEVATLVFMMYVEQAGQRTAMATQVVDTGYGLERLTWLSQGTPSAYEAVFGDTLGYLKRATGQSKTDDRVLREYSKVAGMTSVESMADIRAIREMAAKRLDIPVEELVKQVRPYEALYAIVDHCRSLMFLLTDGVVPSNVKEGYFARLLVRRAMRALKVLDLEMKLSDPITFMIEQYKDDFPELLENRGSIQRLLDIEEKRYKETLEKGREIVRRMEVDLTKGGKTSIDTEALIQLYDSHGLNPDVVQEFAATPVTVPDDFYARVAARHERQADAETVARAPSGLPPTILRVYEKRARPTFRAKILAIDGESVVLDHTYFYPEGGGQEADHGYVGGYRVHDVQKAGESVLHLCKEAAKLKVGKTVKCEIDWDRRQALMRHHTATHITLGAARKVLGPHIWQTGAHKGQEGARLDITHFEALSDEQMRRIEETANDLVLKGEKVHVEVLPRDRAEAVCGFRLYQGGSVPGGQLRVVTIPDWDCEACGGTHVHNTAEVGLIKLLRTKRIQDGVVRLEFVAGKAALAHYRGLASMTDGLALKLNVAADAVGPAMEKVVTEWRELQKEVQRARHHAAAGSVQEIAETAPMINGVRLVVHEVEGGARELSAVMKEVLSDRKALCILGGRGETASLAVGRSPEVEVSCSELLAAGIGFIGGKGGGKPNYAQGGGPDVAMLASALEAIRAAAERALADRGA